MGSNPRRTGSLQAKVEPDTVSSNGEPSGAWRSLKYTEHAEVVESDVRVAWYGWGLNVGNAKRDKQGDLCVRVRHAEVRAFVVPQGKTGKRG